MSVSFSWIPKEQPEPNFFGRGSSLDKALESTFGGFPLTLNGDDLEKLEVMKNCGFDDLSEVINAIHENDCIEINHHY